MSKPISPMRRMVWAMRRERLLRENAEETSWERYFGVPPANWPTSETAPLDEAVRYMVHCEFQRRPPAEIHPDNQ